jgi:hypothetical protein
MVSFAVLLLAVSSRGFTFKNIVSPVTPIFLKLPREASSQNRLLLANGKPTGIIFPPNFEPYTCCYNAQGKPQGGLVGDFSGAYSGTISLVVLPEGGRYRFVQPLKSFVNSTLVAQGKDGSLLGLAYNGLPSSTDDAHRDDSHAFLIVGQKTIDLGPATTVKFLAPGSIWGEFLGDHLGRPISAIVDGDGYYFQFVWKKGRRHILPGKRKAG